MARLHILHLSDTHLYGDDSRHYDVVDTADHLRRALTEIEGRRFDLVVCSGDVSEDGTVASYERARDVLLPWAHEHGARVVFAMGNHDARGPFRTVLGGGQPEAKERVLPGDDDERPIASVATYDGWRVVVLDSSVPGAGYGSIEQEQREFLSEILAEPAAHGTVVIVHHPPVAAQTTLLDALALGDEDAAWLLDAVRGTDVRAILSGHYHLPIVEIAGGVIVTVAPGVTNVSRALADPAEESSADAFGGASVEIEDERVRVVPFVSSAGEGEVFHMDAETSARVASQAGRPQR